jgi:hypothetical protein
MTLSVSFSCKSERGGNDIKEETKNTPSNHHRSFSFVSVFTLSIVVVDRGSPSTRRLTEFII